jgi:Ser/Thr protein kinase RdoA (MazF antagonist)
METKIKKALVHNPSVGIDIKSITTTSLLGGKESSIYKVTDQNDKCVVVKIPKTDWQKREIRVFDEYLSKLNITTPKLLGEYKDEVLIIEFLNGYTTLNEFSLNELTVLMNWIVTKHKKSKEIFVDETRSLSKHVDWMINDPIKRILSDISVSTDIKSKLTRLKPKLVETLNTVDLPLVLDHCDLEAQNLLFNSKRDKVYVVDWANAIKSPGFFDISQFRKLVRQYFPSKAADLTTQLMEEVGYTKPKHQDLLEVFMLTKEIDLLSYYLRDRNKNRDFKKEIAYSRDLILS